MAFVYGWQPAVAALCSTHVAPKAASAWLLKPATAAGPSGAVLQTALFNAAQDFARARRIVKTDEFSSVFRLRPVFRTAHFVLYTRSNALCHARLGVVAAKRLAPRAVTRNTVKRATREMFRLAELPPIDCIVRLSKAVNTKQQPGTTSAIKAMLRAELLRLFASQRGAVPP